MEKTLKMFKFRVKVLVVPTVLEQKMFGHQPYEEEREIEGHTLKDAKKRAGIK